MLYIHEYPLNIPIAQPRLDAYTNASVVRGKIFDLYELKTPVNKKEFDEILQCSPRQPDLDGKNGCLSLLKMIPPTKEITEMMCVYAETKNENWNECRKLLSSYKAGKYPSSYRATLNGFEGFSLFRVMNGQLYGDWPWGDERFTRQSNDSILFFIRSVIHKIKDIPDSIFFLGGEQPSFPWNYIFPSFHYAPGLNFNHIPIPWFEQLNRDKSIYKTIYRDYHANFSYDNMNTVANNRYEWSKRLSIGAFYSSYNKHRQIIYELARKYPSLLHAYFDCNSNEHIISLDVSDETLAIPCGLQKNNISEHDNIAINEIKQLSLGHAKGLLTLLNEANINHEKFHYPSQYKYVIVPLGSRGLSTSGRLGALMAYSGCVILLQEGSFTYHFKERMKPWIHYIPLSYSMADVVEKIEWLRNHDDMAKQIAQNARIFADSYLRLEDHYCYMSEALYTIGKIFNGNSATKPFHPFNFSQVTTDWLYL